VKYLLLPNLANHCSVAAKLLLKAGLTEFF